MYRERTAHIGIRVDIELKIAIEQAADAEDRSVSNWIARIAAKEIERLKAAGR